MKRFVSRARNLGDTTRWRALRDVEGGCQGDAGARALSLCGWRGIGPAAGPFTAGAGEGRSR
jgi:hypothetical protein